MSFLKKRGVTVLEVVRVQYGRDKGVTGFSNDQRRNGNTAASLEEKKSRQKDD